MDWPNDLELEVIEEYRKSPCFWDATNFKYKFINNKNNAWKVVADLF
jgi:hypothetical protein